MAAQDGAPESDIPLPRLLSIGAFIGISWYNVLALSVIIWFYFKRWTGLYFYTLLISAWGCVLDSLGTALTMFTDAPFAISAVLASGGWVAMVTGQNLVLYSRLHLVLHDRRKLRWVLAMIVIDAVLFHTPTIVMFILKPNSRPELAYPYFIWGRCQATVFFLQETIIESLYIYEVYKLLQPSLQQTARKSRDRQVMIYIILANICVILLDISILCVHYALLPMAPIYKTVVYSIKLMIEFLALNQIQEIAGVHRIGCNYNSNIAYRLSGVRAEELDKQCAARAGVVLNVGGYIDD